jgi:hypothetical protein
VKVAASSRLARKPEKRTLTPVQLPLLGLLERIATELDQAVADGALQEICHAQED